MNPTTEPKPQRILSGVQPSGKLHLGNYFGAIKQHIALQDEAKCFYFIADYHALTTLEDELRGASDPQGFIARWLQRGLYYSAPDWVFSAVYVGFALLVALTYWRFPPRR